MGGDFRRSYEDLSASTAWEVLEASAERLPDKVAAVDGERRAAYRDILEESSLLADRLSALGLSKGDVAAVYLPNSLELVQVFYALQKLGVVIAWINPNYRGSETEFILRKSRARVLFLFDEWDGYDCLSAALELPSLAHLERIVVCRGGGESGAGDSRVVRMDRLPETDTGDKAAEAAAKGVEGPPEVGPDDLSMLIFTSGTTGRPKGAMIRQHQVVKAGYSYSFGVDATEDDVFIGFLPMSHSYGCGSLLVQPFILGSSLVVLDKFSPERAFELIEKEGVTLQLAAPAHYIMELQSARRREYDLSTLRAGLIAGQLAPAGLITRVEEEMGVHISSFLGLSEVGPGLSLILPYGTPLEVRENAVGFPLEGTRAKVVDPFSGEELDPGESGELLLKGWHVTEGYWEEPEETANQIRDGWLHTGDLAVRDEGGCFNILGRIKECINRGGFKIVPSEIEALLVKRPDVAEACVVGTSNPVLGESICACVVLEEGAPEPRLEEIRSELKARVARFKLPDELVVFEEFPRMPGGVKVNRFGSGGVVELAEEARDKQTVHG